MTTLPDQMPDPMTDPAAFLRAVLGSDDPMARATAAGCDVHRLIDPPGQAATATAGLQAAGARAIAASLARGARPMLLISQGCPASAEYAQALVQGLMGYERIVALVGGLTGGSGAVAMTGDSRHDGLRLILILPPTAPNPYWQG